MSLDFGSGWAAVTASPVFGIVVTLAAYGLGREAWKRSGRRALVNPVLCAVVIAGTVLWVCDVDYETYMRGGALVSVFLGPATVALAWPMHQQLGALRRMTMPVLLGVVVGSGVAVVAAVTTTRVFGGSEELARTMAPKSATTPVSIAISETIGGLPALTAVLTILAGILGASVGLRLLDLVRVRDARVRGLSVGVASHGIGTAQMLLTGRAEGAFAGVAMALTALATALWVPILLPLLT